MALAERLNEMLAGLPRGWERAHVELTLEESEDADRAALILGPATPGRTGSTFQLHVANGSARLGATPEVARRVLARLDEEGIRARIKLAGHEEPAPGGAPAETRERRTLAAAWDGLVERLPPDWTDLYAEIELDSTDYLERGALLLAPVNPARYGPGAAFRFRCASTKGYGVAQGMARRCLERLDEERITGRVRVLRIRSDTDNVSTQGPVWLVGGRSV